MDNDRIDHPAWPLRAWILLGLGALLGLVFYKLMDGAFAAGEEDTLRLAAASFVAVGGLAFAFTLERVRWQWTLLFAIAAGLVMGGVVYWNSEVEGWRLASLLLAIGIAAPLFQAMRDEGRWTLGPRPIHAHAWTNAVLWCAAWLFVGLVFLLTLLMGQLFALVGIDLIQELMWKGWFAAMLGGASLGAVIGLLRDRDRVLGLLQRVATIVLSVLTPFLAVGLALFLLALPFTGLAPLWRETFATTPILLSCVVVAAVFINATIGNGPDEEPGLKVLLWSALLLVPTILPLAVVAAVSLGMRIGQYGFTPDRLWAGTCILVALAFGVAYLAALAWGRVRWPDRVRQLNVWVALGICALALLLATPLLDFGAISARDQLARLDDGRAKAEQFDWKAMAFDFGPSGRKALDRLKLGGKTAEIRKQAGEALAAGQRWDIPSNEQKKRERESIEQLRIVPKAVPLPPALQDAIKGRYACSGTRPCTLYWAEGSADAVLVSQPSCAEAVRSRHGQHPGPDIKLPCAASTQLLYRSGDGWIPRTDDAVSGDTSYTHADQIVKAWDAGEVTVREVTRRQAFVGDQPVGTAFE